MIFHFNALAGQSPAGPAQRDWRLWPASALCSVRSRRRPFCLPGRSGKCRKCRFGLRNYFIGTVASAYHTAQGKVRLGDNCTRVSRHPCRHSCVASGPLYRFPPCCAMRPIRPTIVFEACCPSETKSAGPYEMRVPRINGLGWLACAQCSGPGMLDERRRSGLLLLRRLEVSEKLLLGCMDRRSLLLILHAPRQRGVGPCWEKGDIWTGVANVDIACVIACCMSRIGSARVQPVLSSWHGTAAAV